MLSYIANSSGLLSLVKPSFKFCGSLNIIGLSSMLTIHQMEGMLIGVFTIMMIEMSNCLELKRIYISHEEDASWGKERRETRHLL